MEDARTAVVDGDGARACGLLTDRGRERAVPFDNAPTCEATLREVRRHDMDDVQDLGRAVLSVVAIDGDRATARLEVPQGEN